MTTEHPAWQEGHEAVYRLTAVDADGRPVETKYFLSPHQVQTWTCELRATGKYTTRAAVVPATEFMELDDAALAALVAHEKGSLAARPGD